MPFIQESVVATALVLAAACAYADEATTPVLTKGRGVAVCDAYLERLKLTEYADPPYCDRPESDEIEGFDRLNRVPLTVDEAFALGDRIRNFTFNGDQDAFTNRRSFVTKAIIQRDLGRSILAWRYEPPVDIDSDGIPDALVVWQGYGASPGNYVCGSVKERDPLYQSQIAYIIDVDTMRINEKKTRDIFGHPLGKYSITVDGKRVNLQRFRPVGLKIGIVKYKGLYYFDTFFDSSGDFRGLRQNDARIGNTLGVFLRSGDTTKQVCEYRWTTIRKR